MGAFIVTIKMHFVEKKMMLISFSGRPLLGPNVIKMSKIAMWALIAIYISSVAWLLVGGAWPVAHFWSLIH